MYGNPLEDQGGFGRSSLAWVDRTDGTLRGELTTAGEK
jgi:hypothetical protein